MAIERADCVARDATDRLAHARKRFLIPEALIYLDGNSLGALPASAPARLANVIAHEWGQDLIRSWNANDWIGMPARLGERIALLIGAAADEVIVADSTSVNLFKLAGAALRLQKPRRVIITESGNFPTDIYVLQGLEELLGGMVALRTVERKDVCNALDQDTALVVLTHVQYKSGVMHDMATLNRAAHAAGALVLWDLSHSAGAMELHLDRDQTDFAIGCGYKYLNGGPGAPSFLYVARRHQTASHQPLTGWMGHAAPFEFGDRYRPAPGMARYLCGTPGILGMAALAEGVATFDGIAMGDVREKSMTLGDLFLSLVETGCAKAGFEVACPTDAQLRGSQVALRHPHRYPIMQALISAGVIGDFRAPDILRFGFTPLYTRYVDIWDAVVRPAKIVAADIWQETRFQARAAVT